MNVRKNIDYSAMFSALDELMATDMPQIKLYYEIGQLVSARQEKGAAVAAAEYLQNTFPETAGFSPRSLRRMREFYRIYESAPEIMNEAMSLGWTQNIVILEADLTVRERLWYIRAALRFDWSKSALAQQITKSAHISLDLAEEVCYTEENDPAGEVPDYGETSSSQCDGAGSSGAADGLPAVFFLFDPQLFYRRIHASPILVCGRRGRSVGMEDGAGPPGRGSIRQAVRPKGRTGQPGVVSRLGELSAQWLRLRCPVRGGSRQLPGEMRDGRLTPGGADAVQGSETAGWVRWRWVEGLRYGDHQSPNADLRYSP